MYLLYLRKGEGSSGRVSGGGSIRSDEHGTPAAPAVAVGPGMPSSIEEGSLFSEADYGVLGAAISKRRFNDASP